MVSFCASSFSPHGNFPHFHQLKLTSRRVEDTNVVFEKAVRGPIFLFSCKVVEAGMFGGLQKEVCTFAVWEDRAFGLVCVERDFGGLI
jgi:hypothetical protein